MWFAFGILLNVHAGRENFDVLQDGLDHRTHLRRAVVRAHVGIRGDTGAEHIHVHAGRGETGDADDVVDLDGDGAHALGNGGCQAAAGADRGQPSFKNRLSLIDIGNHSPSDSVLRLHDCAFRRSTSNVHCGQIRSGQNCSQFDVGGSGNHPRRRRLGRPQSTSNHAKDQEGASARDDESQEEDRK